MAFHRRAAEGMQAERLRGLREFMQMVVQRGDKARKLARDAPVVPAHVALDALLAHRAQQVGGQLVLDRAGILRDPCV